jgi:hypothetical protein
MKVLLQHWGKSQYRKEAEQDQGDALLLHFYF